MLQGQQQGYMPPKVQYLKNFIDLAVSTYDGKLDPIEAESWLKTVMWKFNILDVVMEYDKGKIVIYYVSVFSILV